MANKTNELSPNKSKYLSPNTNDSIMKQSDDIGVTENVVNKRRNKGGLLS